MFASTAPRHRARRSLISRVPKILGAAGIVAVVTVAAVSSGDSSYALWNDGHTVAAATLKAGTLNVTVNGMSSYALSSVPWQALLPGDSVRQQVTVANTGTINALIEASTVASNSALEVRVLKGSCGPVLGGTSSTVSATALGAWAPGEASVVCVQVSLATSAPQSAQGAPMTFTLTFTAKQA